MARQVAQKLLNATASESGLASALGAWRRFVSAQIDAGLPWPGSLSCGPIVNGAVQDILPAGALLPLIAIRLRGPGSTLPATLTNLRRTVQLLNFTIASLAAADTSLYRLLLNPTRGAGTAPTWVAADALSSVEYDITSTQVLTGGYEIDAGYAQGRNTFAGAAASQARPGADYAGTTADELVLAAQAQTGTNNLLAATQWVEL